MFKECIDNILVHYKICSLRNAASFLRTHQVFVNDERITCRNFLCDSFSDKICVDNKILPPAKNIYLMMNKPCDVVCTTTSDKKTLIYDLLPQELLNAENLGKIHTVGRLDYDTEGLIFLTTNGKFSNFIASPQTQIQKTYFVTLQNQVSSSQKQKYTELLKEGIFLPAENKSPAFTTKKATLIWKSDTECELTIQEGKFHQVKRMFAALGNSVAKLKRIKIGNIELDKTLLPGEFRALTLQELNSFIQN